ncbi:neprilysin-1-like [Dermacentor albipictus]|uniref:neprilysin-1-like n=1 Tax=Dermacentor albipictus TaxID=60249 RepID=UPI0031FC8E16
MAVKPASLSRSMKKHLKLVGVSQINALHQGWVSRPSESSSEDSDGARPPWCVRVLALGALAAIMAAAIVALVMTPPPRPREDDRWLARQHAAPLSALEENHFARLSRSLNRMADPCRDFYAYVCANWEPPRDVFAAPWKRSPLPGWEWTNAASGPAGGSASVRRVSAALTKCWRVFTDRHETQPELVRALRSLGVPVNPRRWEILDRPLDVLVRLSLRAALPVTLLAEPTADLRAPGQMIVLLAQGRIYKQWAEARLAADPKALQASAELIGGAKFARDVVSVESIVSRWADTFASGHAGSEPEYLTVRSLALRTPGISVHEWLRAINQSPPVYVSAADDVYVFDQRGVQLTHRIDAHFGGGRRREVLRWIAALVFHYLAPATSYNLMLRFGRPPQRSCYEYALALAPYALVTQAARRRVWPEEVSAARAVYERLRAVVRSSLADWMASRAAREEAETRVNALSVVLGVPDHLNTAAGLDAEYDYLEGFHSVFIRDLLRSFKAKAKRAARLFNASQSAPVANLRTAMYSGAPHPSIGDEPFFVPFYHVIVVPPRFLAPPFVLINSSAASYGGFGHVIGAAMLEAFDSHGLLLSHLGIRAEWLDSTTREKWASKRKCLQRRYATGAAPFDADYSRNTLDENYADVAGYEAALRALRSDPSYRPREESPVAELNNEQLFYVSLCHKWCSRGRPLLRANDTSRTRADHKCNIALPTVAGFADAFGCAPRFGDVCDVL